MQSVKELLGVDIELYERDRGVNGGKEYIWITFNNKDKIQKF